MSPRTKEQNEEIRKQRTQEILAAAIHIYSEKGYAASEIGDVAERAGLARGLVYHYFKSKQALFRELYESMMNRTEQFTKTHFEQEGSVLELFGGYALAVCRQVLEEPSVSRFYMRISMDVHYLYTDEPFSPFVWMKRFLQPMAAAIGKGIEQSTIRTGDANLMAMQFWGAVSHGMNYLDKLQQQLRAEETAASETKQQLEQVLEQVVESALAVVKPA
ncbi:TetR/AcrR family transcriptional regulator [Paenibacillaceae bacterium]|nr:TetR/AcrR family transcriptional regulator [Paenibacillaceae bacterium]